MLPPIATVFTLPTPYSNARPLEYPLSIRDQNITNVVWIHPCPSKCFPIHHATTSQIIYIIEQMQLRLPHYPVEDESIHIRRQSQHLIKSNSSLNNDPPEILGLISAPLEEDRHQIMVSLPSQLSENVATNALFQEKAHISYVQIERPMSIQFDGNHSGRLQPSYYGDCSNVMGDAVTVMENDRSDNTMKLLTVNEKLPKSRRQKNPKIRILPAFSTGQCITACPIDLQYCDGIVARKRKIAEKPSDPAVTLAELMTQRYRDIVLDVSDTM
uniref:Uncharacterized protein n=1 Tax=Ascaris lumbricoides TaxID=6252 RepID=A0A0M3HYH7_ASCLU